MMIHVYLNSLILASIAGLGLGLLAGLAIEQKGAREFFYTLGAIMFIAATVASLLIFGTMPPS